MLFSQSLSKTDPESPMQPKLLAEESSVLSMSESPMKPKLLAEESSVVSMSESPMKPKLLAEESSVLSMSDSLLSAQLKTETDHQLYSEKKTKLLSLIPITKQIIKAISKTHSKTDLLLFPQIDQYNLVILKDEYKSLGISSSSITSIRDSSEIARQKLVECSAHLDRLFLRISDTRSRVLVTGDLNAGKSTFVNAMLRREVVPDDQQPCTALFAEVVDCDQNDGLEEVHGIIDANKYKKNDSTSFKRIDIRHLRDVVEENVEGFELLKIYCRDRRERHNSLLHNGVVDISLIDSPGLNIDSMKTTALFAQQEEIDVVIFVVNAENHFTLSGREFLHIAGKEKAYIFVVVNKFDQIKRRADRCKNEILEQIKEISPRTFQDMENLVHFVSAKECLKETPENPKSVEDFIRMEDCLRSFILEKRTTSKLLPAKIYLSNLLNDIEAISIHNSQISQTQIETIESEIQSIQPSYHGMLDLKYFLDEIDIKINDTTDEIHQAVQTYLTDFIDNIEFVADDVEWHSIIYMFHYAKEIRNHVYKHAEKLLLVSQQKAYQVCLSTFGKIEVLARECGEDLMICAEDKDVFKELVSVDEPREKSLIELPEFNEFLDTGDKIGIVREFGPAVGIFGVGSLGYNGAFRGLFHAGFSIPKIAFAGLTIAGVGLFFFALSDIKSILLKKVVQKIRIHLNESEFTSFNTLKLTKKSRKVLSSSMYEYSTRFQRRLKQTQTSLGVHEERKAEAVRRGVFFEGVKGECRGVGGVLDGIDLS